MSKIVVLKGGIKASLYLSNVDNDFYIWAKDENNNKVGFCQFNLSYEYERKLGDDYRAIHAEYHKIPIEQVPHKQLCKVDRLEFFTIQGNKLVCFNGESFDIKNRICDLQKIEILDERYFKKGLGHVMLKALESVAIKNNCTRIEAYFSPYGNFSHGTLEFYKRNGFEFYKHQTFKIDYIRKYLSGVETNSNNIAEQTL